MGRSVDYLSNAIRVNYFDYPELISDEGEHIGYEDAEYVIEDIQETIKSEYPNFRNVDNWDGETHIILEGYGLQIGLSEYCGFASLSVRVDEFYDDEEDIKSAEEWVEQNWDEATKYWNRYRRVGTFSNGCGVYEIK